MPKFTPLLLLFTLLLGIGCEMEEINTNPNNPTQVPLNTLLPPAQGRLANTLGGAVFRYTNIFSNHTRGAFGQDLDINNYNVNKTFVGYMWSDLYGVPMMNLNTIINQAEATQSPHYGGVAKVMMAVALGTVTEIWGDAPYSEAFDKNNLNPAFDPQEQIYQTIQNLLDEAITDLSASQSVYKPGNDDLIYKGNLTAWKRAAYALKARYRLHLSNRFPQLAEQILPLTEQGFTSSAQDMQYVYPNTSSEPNPIYQYYKETPNMLIDSHLRNLLLGDPRSSYLIKRKPFSADTIVGDFYASLASPIPIITYTEQKFIEAECLLRTGANAQDALAEAVRSSVTKISGNAVSDEIINTYITDRATLTGNFDQDLNTILTQKYIALFTQSQPWTDYRRTELPPMQPNPNGITNQNPNGQIPRRLLYPEQEELLNANFPKPAPDMQTPLWWDTN
ncbi:MAG TPA: SusD/RagB family nutrient-binding outer membrane lipoprotein [Chitinophagales bacterium]|nr:SusD/RagB family nutrient-binding outer membrane lipoprotein [Chitinophagales bacterium]HRK27180.1 SusD/RagB family nutrient-binding outer membrane lipoprotein [Chitinophagales bacterium]